MEVTITEILDDLRAMDEITRRYERRFWLSSADFHSLYQQGRLDNGEHLEEFTEWAAAYEIKLDREKVLEELSNKRLQEILANSREETVSLETHRGGIDSRTSSRPFHTIATSRQILNTTAVPLPASVLPRPTCQH